MGPNGKCLLRKDVNKNLVRILRSYQSRRRLIFEAEGKKKIVKVYRAVPQGSILGLVVWNLLYDDLFKLKLPERVTLKDFADDVAMNVTVTNGKCKIGTGQSGRLDLELTVGAGTAKIGSGISYPEKKDKPNSI